MTGIANPRETATLQRAPAAGHGIPFGAALRVWLRVAALSFGGPAGQIAVMHRILVEEKRWISETRFLHALNYCMLLPGPEAQQLAIYIGWLLHRTPGGLAAGTLFVLPGFLSIMVLSWLYAGLGNVSLVQALFFGLKAAVLAVVVEAVIRVGRRALKNRTMVGLAAAAFVALFVFDVPFPVVILTAALIGYAAGHAGVSAFLVQEGQGRIESAAPVIDRLLEEETPAHVAPSTARAMRVLAVGLTLWLGPVLALLFTLGSSHVFSAIAVFFSKMAVVTFGGAYAVLAYVAQQAVEHYHWLQPGEMLDGLGLAETTPGPLIQVVQFVGFLAAYRDPGALPPLLVGTLAGVLTTWVTFVPCFLWIFLGAPYIEALRGHRALGAALATITAAVVGVIFNLAVWFGLHVLFTELTEVRAFGLVLSQPVVSTINLPSLVLMVGALVAMLRFRVGMLPTLAGCAAAGAVYRLLF